MNWGIVVRLNELALSFDVPRYYLSSVFVPYSLMFLELMGVDPWLQRAFLLSHKVGEYFHCPYKYLFW
jgi:hypothetical protein